MSAYPELQLPSPCNLEVGQGKASGCTDASLRWSLLPVEQRNRCCGLLGEGSPLSALPFYSDWAQRRDRPYLLGMFFLGHVNVLEDQDPFYFNGFNEHFGLCDRVFHRRGRSRESHSRARGWSANEVLAGTEKDLDGQLW